MYVLHVYVIILICRARIRLQFETKFNFLYTRSAKTLLAAIDLLNIVLYIMWRPTHSLVQIFIPPSSIVIQYVPKHRKYGVLQVYDDLEGAYLLPGGPCKVLLWRYLFSLNIPYFYTQTHVYKYQYIYMQYITGIDWDEHRSHVLTSSIITFASGETAGS